MESLDGVCGTAAFMAPEMLEEKEYDYSVDMWAIGVILYCLFYGEFPWSTEDQNGLFGRALVAVRKSVLLKSTEPAVFRSSKQNFQPVLLSDPAVELLQSMLMRDPMGRVTADAALKSQYMSEVYLPFKDAELSSLLPMLDLAREARLFHKGDVTEEARLDPLLERLNKKYAGLGSVVPRVVERVKQEMSTPRSNGSPSPGAVTPTSSGAASPRLQQSPSSLLLRAKSNLSSKSKESAKLRRAESTLPECYSPLRRLDSKLRSMENLDASYATSKTTPMSSPNRRRERLGVDPSPPMSPSGGASPRIREVDFQNFFRTVGESGLSEYSSV